MGFTGKNNPCVVRKKQKKILGHNNSELTVNKPVCKTSKIFAANISYKSSVQEDVDLDEHFDMERCLEDKECIWLSSDCMSPSSFFEEHELSGPFNLHADDSLISWLPTLANSYLHLGKGSNTLFNELLRTNSMKTISAAEETFQESLKEKGGETDSSSLSLDTERSKFCVSLMDLDGEDSNWISDEESDFDNFQSGIPSPFYRSSWGSEIKSNYSGPSVPAEVENNELSLKHASEAADLENFSADEPLFWPFEQEKDWSSEEAWKCFSMSPRKGLIKVKTPEQTSTESTGLQNRARKLHPKNGCERKIVLGSGSAASKILELKQRINSKDAKQIERMPSRLRNSNKLTVKVVPLEMEDDHRIEPAETKVPVSKSPCMDRSLFDDDFVVNDELPIETVLGLGEFDGHEGVDSDLNEDFFFLERSL